MEPIHTEFNSQSTTEVCPVCYQPIRSTYHFCPNCGTKLNSTLVSLSTSVGRQVWIYFFSAILPLLGFIFITRWPGTKYFKSKDEKAHQIGQIAWSILIVSTIVTVWYAYVWTQQYIQSTVDSINSDFSGL